MWAQGSVLYLSQTHVVGLLISSLGGNGAGALDMWAACSAGCWLSSKQVSFEQHRHRGFSCVELTKFDKWVLSP